MTIRWMSARMQSVALLVSLAVNLLLISAIAAFALRGHSHSHHNRMAAGIEHMADKLPDADAARLRAAYKAHLDEFNAARRDVQTLRDAVRDTLRAQPVDPKALDQAIDKLASRRAAMDRTFMHVVANSVVQMSPQGRAKLLDRRHDR